MKKRIRGVYERDKGAGVWWIRYWDTAKGRIVREKIGNKAAAIKLYQKRKTEVLQQVKLPENFRAKPVELKELIREAMQHSETNNRGHKQDRLRLLTIGREFGNRIAESITPQEINRWLSGQGWSEGTINRHRSTFSLVFRLGIEARKLKENPVRQVKRRKEDNGRTRFLSDDEETKLRAVIASRYSQHMSELDIALNTGLRRGEQYALTWRDVNFPGRMLTVSQTKNGETRHVRLNSAALSAFAELYRTSPGSGYVFTNRLGERLLKGRHWFEPAISEARINDFTWHCLRHTFASRLIMNGVDLRTVQQLMGHKTIQMTVRYAHLAPEHQLAAVEKLCSTVAPLVGLTDTRTDTAQIIVVPGNHDIIN
jgi:site-specific recombinase XerD